MPRRVRYFHAKRGELPRCPFGRRGAKRLHHRQGHGDGAAHSGGVPASRLTSDSASLRLEGLALWAALAAALQGAFWAYDGWNTITFVAGEVKTPQRNIPRGLIGGMLIVMCAYLLMNFAYAYVLP